MSNGTRLKPRHVQVISKIIRRNVDMIMDNLQRSNAPIEAMTHSDTRTALEKKVCTAQINMTIHELNRIASQINRCLQVSESGDIDEMVKLRNEIVQARKPIH